MRGIFCLTLILFIACTAFAASTPEQAVRDTQRAINAKDADRFDQLVDTSRIVNAATQLLLAEAGKPDSQLPSILAFMLSSAKDSPAFAALRELIARETHAFVRYGISSGHFAGKPDDSAYPGGVLLTLLFSDVSMGRKELRVAGPSAPDGQDRVFLPVELKDYGNGNTYPLLLRLQWHAPDWRTVEIVNLSDVWNQIQAEAAEQH